MIPKIFKSKISDVAKAPLRLPRHRKAYYGFIIASTASVIILTIIMMP